MKELPKLPTDIERRRGKFRVGAAAMLEHPEWVYTIMQTTIVIAVEKTDYDNVTIYHAMSPFFEPMENIGMLLDPEYMPTIHYDERDDEHTVTWTRLP